MIPGRVEAAPLRIRCVVRLPHDARRSRRHSWPSAPRVQGGKEADRSSTRFDSIRESASCEACCQEWRASSVTAESRFVRGSAPTREYRCPQTLRKRSGKWPVGDPNLRLSHRQNPCDYPPPPYRLTVSTYIVSFVSLTALHFVLTFLPAYDITLSWLAMFKT
jgi:hypothetical protein